MNQAVQLPREIKIENHQDTLGRNVCTYEIEKKKEKSDHLKTPNVVFLSVYWIEKYPKKLKTYFMFLDPFQFYMLIKAIENPMKQNH